MKPVRVHPEAEAESDGAFEWYWARSSSAGMGFDAALRDAFGNLRRSPKMCAPYLYGTRRVMLHRYPYFVVFRKTARKDRDRRRSPRQAPSGLLARANLIQPGWAADAVCSPGGRPLAPPQVAQALRPFLILDGGR